MPVLVAELAPAQEQGRQQEQELVEVLVVQELVEEVEGVEGEGRCFELRRQG